MAARQSLIIGALVLLLAGTAALLGFRHFYSATEEFYYGRGYAVLQPKSEISPADYDVPTLRKGGMLMNEEVMKNAPNERTPFQEGSNPCWKTEGGSLLCLPKLVLLGGFHSGSGGLIHALMQHPQIVTTRSSNCQFWAEDGKTMADYVTGHQDAIPKLKADDKAIIMEHSQSTFAFYWSAGTKTHMKFIQTVRLCHDNCSRSNPVEADRLHCMDHVCLPSAHDADTMVSNLAGLDYLSDQHVPCLMRAVYGTYVPRLVALVRDPIERIHSAFWGHAHYMAKYGESPEGFLAFVREQTQAFETCSDTYGALRCALMFETLGMREEGVHYHCDQLLRGMYSVWIEIWLRFFPRDSFLLLKSEDVFEDMAATVQRVVQHAGLPPVDKETAHGWASLYTIPRHVKNRVMMPEARAILHDFYMPYNLRLAKITGVDDYLKWNSNQESKLGDAIAAAEADE